MEKVTADYPDLASVVEDIPGDVPEAEIPNGQQSPFTTAHMLGPYNTSGYDYRYVDETGYDVLPTSTGKGVKVKIHGGLSELHVYWTVERLFELPELPKLDTDDTNLVPIRRECTPASVFQSKDGPVYRVSGVNRYKMLDAKLAVNPVDGTGATPNPSYFVQGTPELINGSFTIADGPGGDFTIDLSQ